ncbi:MAG: TlpA disulfide reductase family protein [Pseudomonadota bacterium]
MNKHIGCLLLLLPALFGGAVWAASVELELESGAVIAAEHFGSGPDRILWFPSEYGISGQDERELSRAVSQQIGREVWLVDLHTSYFLSPGRTSLAEVPLEDIRDLISVAMPERGRLYLLSYGRGAALALEAVRLWQLDNGNDSGPLGGAILLHPNLMAGTAKAGERAAFLPIVSATNLPIFIFQPMNSAKRWYLEELVERLGEGGSDVYFSPMPKVSDGFQVRDDVTAHEREVQKHLPAMFRTAIRLLGSYNSGRREPAAGQVEAADEAASSIAAGLQPIAGHPSAPSLALTDIDGRNWTLEELRGEVVLLNFWATWCPPCVEEIPSLGRLNRRLEDKPFRVISVDVGQEEAEVRRFLDKVPADFPVLLDPEGSVTGPWKIRAFPTSFLIDADGRMRYGYFGALEWDSDEVVAVIESVLSD